MAKKKGKGSDILLAPFLPLVGIAKKIYKKRTGKQPPKKPKELLIAFYRDVMKRKYEYEYHLEPATIGMIVGAVVAFITDLIKKSKEKKKRGEQLNEEEQELSNSNADQAEGFIGNPNALARIAEYVPLMEEYYQETTGRALQGDIFNKIKRFHTDVVQRAAQFDFDFSQFEASFTIAPIAENYEYDTEYDTEYNFDAGTAISSIIAFFQRFRDRVRERQKAGQPVRPFESKIADAVDRIERRAISEAQQTVSQQVQQSVGRSVLSATPIILIGLAALVAFIWASKKK